MSPHPLSPLQLRTILLCAAVVVLDGFDTQCMGFLVPIISQNLDIPLPAFGPVLAAALVGLMIAAMGSGPVADTYGRRVVVTTSVVVFAVFALLTARANTVRELILLRFLTGLGLGGALPNAVALTAEYTPARLQSTVVSAIFVGMPAGALLASQTAAVVIPVWGWRAVLVIGGVLPLLLAAVLVARLPESAQFLSARGAKDDGVPVKHLFAEGRAPGTLLLWVPFFMNLLILYFVVSWLPALLRELGMPVSVGVQAIALFSVGGMIGTLFQGSAMSAIGARTVLLVEFFVCTSLIAVLALAASYEGLLMIATLALGTCVQGAQAGLNALAASFYPTRVRATGIGWALGIGRIGSIVGPSLGGVLLSLQWSPSQIFLSGMGPAVCAAAAIVTIGWLPDRANAFHAA
jgi:AAHS family 4-hydroxybenzoate transporter-like MFS transporter